MEQVDCLIVILVVNIFFQFIEWLLSEPWAIVSEAREPPHALVFVSNAVRNVLHKQIWLAGMNSLVLIEMVEGDLVKRALSALIWPSSHQHRRQFDFQPCPSRLSIMSKAEDH
ncbi:Uncharacterized protein Fot_18545 [Forsythia ovata]|uniref:Uncharacterized protein n=1 Tax=Forsythia ovata TaxID=205694 RepID=A0ABD1VIJ9_9LAMI